MCYYVIGTKTIMTLDGRKHCIQHELRWKDEKYCSVEKREDKTEKEAHHGYAFHGILWYGFVIFSHLLAAASL